MGRTDDSARGLEPTVPDAHADAARLLALVVVVGLVFGLAAWLISPRFELETPSLVDDWSAISRSQDQLDEAFTLRNPEEQRFRPGWIVWNWLQWHTLDAPGGMVGPNVWNLLRALILVAGLTLATSLLLTAPRSLGAAILHAALAGVPAFLVVTVPKFAETLTRFGPQEPLLVGGMALGGSLLVLAARALLDPAGPARPLATAALAVAGGVFWLLGVYQKEASLAVVPLVVAVLFAARDDLARWRVLGTYPKAALMAIGIIVVLPLVHTLVHSLLILLGGDLVYGAEVDAGQTAAEGLVELWRSAHETLPEAARAIVLVALLLVPVVVAVRRTLDGIALGTLATGVLVLLVAGQAGLVAPRYYLPAYAVFAVLLVRSLAFLPLPIQAAAVAAVFFAFTPLTEARSEVSFWVEEERHAGTLVRAVTEVDGAGCVVATAGLDLETRYALPVLVGVERGPSSRSCGKQSRYFVVGTGDDAAALLRTCAPGELDLVASTQVTMLYRCGRLRPGRVEDPSFGPLDAEVLVALRRFHPTRETG